jgi:hypothetical protein
VVDPADSSSAYRWLYRLVEHRYGQQVPEYVPLPAVPRDRLSAIQRIMVVWQIIAGIERDVKMVVGDIRLPSS